MNKTKIKFVVFMCVCASVFCMFGMHNKSVMAEDFTKNKIYVCGEASLKVKPNIAAISVGVECSGQDVEQIKNEVAQKVEAIILAIQSQNQNNIIETESYNIFAEYNFLETKQPVAHKVYTTLRIETPDIDRVEDIINVAVGAGANITNGVYFKISDSSNHYLTALEQALEQAKQKAQKIADLNGGGTLKVVNIKESACNSSSVQPFYCKISGAERNYISVADCMVNACVMVVFEVE